jgi:hypothetical protein
MDSLVAIVVYGCAVNGVRTETLDVRVRYFESTDIESVEERIRREPLHAYANDRGETVGWPFIRIAAIEPLGSLKDGAEIVGFISDITELGEGASGRDVNAQP